MAEAADMKLQPCPFCQAAPISLWVGNSTPGMEDCGYWAVECRPCGNGKPTRFVGVHGEDRVSAEARWNARAPLSTTQALPQRYDINPVLYFGQSALDIDADQRGKWVKWEDVKHLFAAPQDGAGSTAGPATNGEPAAAGIRPTARRSEPFAHDWQPDGGVLRFESHPGGEAHHVHTTCAKCDARAWFLEYQWELLSKGCARSTPQKVEYPGSPCPHGKPHELDGRCATCDCGKPTNSDCCKFVVSMLRGPIRQPALADRVLELIEENAARASAASATLAFPVGWSAKLVSTNPGVYEISTPYGARVAQEDSLMPNILFELVHAIVAGKAPTIERMVDRFLAWPLPRDFAPDCGIKFTPVNHPHCWPIGTNLLNADQAKAMLEHVLRRADGGREEK